MITFCNKNKVSFTLGVHQYTYQYQGTPRCEHCRLHSIVKRKRTVFLQYFFHDVLYSGCCGGHCSLLPSSAQKNWSIFDCFTSLLVAWSTFCSLWISHALTVCKPRCCYTSNCSNKRCACSNSRIIYKSKKIGSFFSAETAWISGLLYKPMLY